MAPTGKIVTQISNEYLEYFLEEFQAHKLDVARNLKAMSDKMDEIMVVVDGIKTKIDQLTKIPSNGSSRSEAAIEAGLVASSLRSNQKSYSAAVRDVHAQSESRKSLTSLRPGNAAPRRRSMLSYGAGKFPSRDPPNRSSGLSEMHFKEQKEEGAKKSTPSLRPKPVPIQKAPREAKLLGKQPLRWKN
ncbi:MAG: hypothetical protein Q9170_006987 [Blastenia crenularia]